MDDLKEEFTISQAKRSMERGEGAANFTSGRSRWDITSERLTELIKSGHATEYLVPTNYSKASMSFGSMADLTGTTVPMSFMGMKKRWNDDHDEEDEDDYEDVLESKKAAAPLLKNTSVSDMEKAQSIVEQAIAESSKLNEVRLLNPMRNIKCALFCERTSSTGIVRKTNCDCLPIMASVGQMLDFARCNGCHTVCGTTTNDCETLHCSSFVCRCEVVAFSRELNNEVSYCSVVCPHVSAQVFLYAASRKAGLHIV